jgi:large subunit ribosomal protein L4
MTMKVDVLNLEGQKVKTVDLPAKIFEAPINTNLMHQAYVRQMANARLGTHKTKSRGEVSGGGRKPWRQKGTGRARQGSIRSPQWVGGGKVHTPRPDLKLLIANYMNIRDLLGFDKVIIQKDALDVIESYLG